MCFKASIIDTKAAKLFLLKHENTFVDLHVGKHILVF